MSRATVGTVTIGQSPRDDIAPELAAVLGADVAITEAGCLDGLSDEEIAALAPKTGGRTLVTRLRDGREVRLATERMGGLLQERVTALEATGVDAIAILCTGRLGALRSTVPLVEAHAVVGHFVPAIAGERRLGVVVPLPAQVAEAQAQWGAVADVRVEAATPYEHADTLASAAEALTEWGAETVLLDCLGFGVAHKAEMARRTGLPVLLPRTILARSIAELLPPA
jgi:protein AroM